MASAEACLAELVNSGDEEGRWYPLTGVKSGKVLLFADFQEDGDYDPNDPDYNSEEKSSPIKAKSEIKSEVKTEANSDEGEESEKIICAQCPKKYSTKNLQNT